MGGIKSNMPPTKSLIKSRSWVITHLIENVFFCKCYNIGRNLTQIGWFNKNCNSPELSMYSINKVISHLLYISSFKACANLSLYFFFFVIIQCSCNNPKPSKFNMQASSSTSLHNCHVSQKKPTREINWAEDKRLLERLLWKH